MGALRSDRAISGPSNRFTDLVEGGEQAWRRAVRRRFFRALNVCDLCGRPFGSKRNLQERSGPWSGADMCAAFDAARSMPRAQMGVRRSGPIQAHALAALVAKLVVPIRSFDRSLSLSCDPPTS